MRLVVPIEAAELLVVLVGIAAFCVLDGSRNLFGGSGDGDGRALWHPTGVQPHKFSRLPGVSQTPRLLLWQPSGLRTQHIREGRLRAKDFGELAFAFERIPDSHSRRFDVQEDLIRPRLGHGELFQVKIFNAAKTVKGGRARSCSLYAHREGRVPLAGSLHGREHLLLAWGNGAWAGPAYLCCFQLRSRSAFPITTTSDSPIAAAQRIGLMKPSAARGIPMAL